MSLQLRVDDGWWQEIPRLISRSLEIYEKLEKDPVQVTAKQIIAHREWMVTEEEIMPAVRDLEFLYIPKRLFPGPMFLFPQKDTEGRLKAQTKPLHNVFGDSKYYSIGTTQEFLGPLWLGNSDNTLELIIKNKLVMLVEGPFDLLACRILAPHVPIMSSRTKTIGKKHQDYLRILGVKEIALMYDNEPSGAGEKAMQALKREIKTMKVSPLTCPTHDPSDCLKSAVKKEALKSMLEQVI